jgi:hypothetical protein
MNPTALTRGKKKRNLTTPVPIAPILNSEKLRKKKTSCNGAWRRCRGGTRWLASMTIILMGYSI